MRPRKSSGSGGRQVAKVHCDEQKLYDRIALEKITIHPFVWDTLYLYLGDHISGINFIVSYYVEKDEPIPIVDCQKILRYARIMNEMVDKILHPEKMEKENHRLEKIKNENMLMHGVVRELVSHYIGNDIMGINFIVSFYLDPKSEEPVPVEDAKKLLNYTQSMGAFLDKLRKATKRDVSF